MTLPLPAPTPYWSGTADVPWDWGRCVATVGVFDGLHRGHARLVERAVALGRERRLPVVLVTFDPHPATVAGPARATTPIVDLARRAELARDLGVDAVLVLPFDRATARTSAVGFVREVLAHALRATDVVVGEDFHFGHRGAGDLRLLRRLGPRYDLRAHGVPLVEGCSSTRVRELVGRGEVEAAAALLGRPHRVHGHALRGGRVRLVSALLPPPGRYRVRVLAGPDAPTAGEITLGPDGRARIAAVLRPGPVALDLLAVVR